MAVSQYLIAIIVYLIGGYIMLALLAHYEAGNYTEWELLLWSLSWPGVLFCCVIAGIGMLCGLGFVAVLGRWRRS